MNLEYHWSENKSIKIYDHWPYLSCIVIKSRNLFSCTRLIEVQACSSPKKAINVFYTSFRWTWHCHQWRHFVTCNITCDLHQIVAPLNIFSMKKIERLQRTSSIRRCATSLHQSPHMVTKASKIFRLPCGWVSTYKTRWSFGNSPSAVTYCYVNCKKIYQVWEADWEAEWIAEAYNLAKKDLIWSGHHRGSIFKLYIS